MAVGQGACRTLFVHAGVSEELLDKITADSGLTNEGLVHYLDMAMRGTALLPYIEHRVEFWLRSQT